MAKKTKNRDLPEELRESAHRIWLAGLGALATAEREGGRLFRTLVDRGEDFEARGRAKAGKQAEKVRETARQAASAAESAWGRLESGLDESLTAALHKVGVPTRQEIQDLTRRVEKLTESVERMGGPAGKKAKRKKTTKKKTPKRAARKGVTLKSTRKRALRKKTAKRKTARGRSRA